MNTENIKGDYDFIVWARGNKRSYYNYATLLIQPRGCKGELRMHYTPGWGWGWGEAHYENLQLMERITSDFSKFCNALFKYRVKDDYYGTKIKWESDGTLRDVSIY